MSLIYHKDRGEFSISLSSLLRLYQCSGTDCKCNGSEYSERWQTHGQPQWSLSSYSVITPSFFASFYFPLLSILLDRTSWLRGNDVDMYSGGT